MDRNPGNPIIRILSATLLAIGLMGAPPVFAELSARAAPGAAPIERLIVKRRAVSSVRGAVAVRSDVRALGERAGVSLSSLRRMSGGAEVLRLPRAMTAAQAQTVAQRLMQDPSVEYAEPDRWVRPFLVPNDPHYAGQWNLHDARSEIATANLPDAWDLAGAAPPAVVAVVDTGLLSHADIDAARVLPGYDFVVNPFTANDGDGRDTDPGDPGDWVGADDCGAGSSAQNSSWHGTHVAGIIGASRDNTIGISGVSGNAKLLPVRVLGRCGGYLSDVLDGARWAAGVADPYLPPNPNPAQILNLSLGAETSCSPLVQSAVDDVVAAGAVIIAAAGNTASSASAIAPGNCAGVIAVAALDRNGNRAYYSSFGSTVALSAPGGAQYYVGDSNGIVSISNTATTAPSPSPGGDTYKYIQGTSMSAPHVAGVASLMLAINPALTPGQIRQKLLATARAFPAGSNCTTATCGAGMLDATVALQSAANALAPTADAGTDQTVVGDTVVLLTAAGSAAAAPASIAQYTWTQVSGPTVAISDSNTVGATFVAPEQGGSLRFQLTVADDGGLAATDVVDVQVAAAAVSAADASPGTGGGDSRCFIATAAYGSPDVADVRQLRRFRNRYLLTNPVGRALVAAYYRLSPPFADAIRPYPLLRKLVRIGLAPYVAAVRWFGASPGANR
ncbi:MAG TPA: S8 family serine peptidase [Burkholderiales bacterium]